MNVTCRDVRDRLAARAVEPEGPVALHLSDCGACARFAERLRVARGLFREHHAGIEPDGQFAGRVVARLDGEPVSPLGWAAVRVLPATLALLVVLAWLSWSVVPNSTASQTVVSPTEDLLTWVLEPGESE
jgi:hypothetical protein